MAIPWGRKTGYYAVYMAGYTHDGHGAAETIGHTVNGQRAHGCAAIPLNRWVWQACVGGQWQQMSKADQARHAAEYAERSRGGLTKIALVRYGRNLTQAEIAARMGITPQAYADVERGRKPPLLDTLQRVAAALGCQVADLID